MNVRRDTAARRPSTETNPSALRVAMQRKVGRKVTGRGEIAFPCVPSLIDSYMTKLGSMFEIFGKPFTAVELDSLRNVVQGKLTEGWAASPFSLLVVEYEIKPPPHPGIAYSIRARVLTMDDRYNEWVANRTPPLFGKLPDAKVMDLVANLGPPPSVPVLDVGAGTGRNTLPLARRGHPTDAIEPVQAMADVFQKVAAEEKLAVTHIQGDVCDPGLSLRAGHYQFIVMAEVVSHFRDVDQIRRAIANLCAALAPGGILLISTFLARDGYKPDSMAREIAQVTWSSIFTRHDFSFVTEEFPLDRVEDESAYEYEKSHLPAEGWPPTGWFSEWAQGLDLFAVPAGKAPMDLRWLVYRRRS